MLGERDAQAILQSLGTLQSKQFQPELAVKLQFIYIIAYKFFGHSKIHNVVIGIHPERFDVGTKLKQMNQSAGRILLRSKDTIQAESLQHRTVHPVDSPCIDAFHLFLFQQRHHPDGSAEILADSDNNDIDTIQRKHGQSLPVGCINHKGGCHLVLQTIYTAGTDVRTYHLMSQSRKLLGKHMTVITQTDNNIFHNQSMLAFRTPVSESHLVNDNLSARILVLRMFFLLDDAEHQCYKPHTSDKH